MKIIEEECDIESAYPSRLYTCTNNHLLKILGKDSKLLHLIIEFYKDIYFCKISKSDKYK